MNPLEMHPVLFFISLAITLYTLNYFISRRIAKNYCSKLDSKLEFNEFYNYYGSFWAIIKRRMPNLFEVLKFDSERTGCIFSGERLSDIDVNHIKKMQDDLEDINHLFGAIFIAGWGLRMIYYYFEKSQ